jgi:hypothetical protein
MSEISGFKGEIFILRAKSGIYVRTVDYPTNYDISTPSYTRHHQHASIKTAPRQDS